MRCLVATLLLVSACAPLGAPGPAALPQRSLGDAGPRGLPFAADWRIRALARELTRRARTDFQKLTCLMAYFRRMDFSRSYSRLGTLTASQALSTGGGNCLAYANLFVAMARAAGLDARFAALRAEHRQLEPSGGLLVDWGHLAVQVRLRDRVLVVDFDGRTQPIRLYEPVSDQRAAAEYYNNLGYELARTPGHGMAAPEVAEAFRRAVAVQPDFAWAWNNLGVALARAGRGDEAERAYHMAASADPALAAPHANLGLLHLRQGRSAHAVEAFERALERKPDCKAYRVFLERARKADRWQRNAETAPAADDAPLRQGAPGSEDPA
ncbi:MAG: tetratricopeptide repeat protein [Deltaproteobacteria bacterium]|nr:tetratricopeptide repeat protein [Deltaproteobacteria bacterium]